MARLGQRFFMSIVRPVSLAVLLLAQAGHVSADAMLWQDTSLSLLYGDDFAVQPPQQTTLTLEHVSGWNWGDLFAFVDYTAFHNSAVDDSYYGEVSPRLSLSFVTGEKLAAGVVNDVFVASTMEFGRGDVETLLIGVGADMDIPGLDYFSLNIYRRFPEGGRDGDTVQLTPVWSVSGTVAGAELTFNGYMDWNINSDNRYEDNLHFNPQLKYDLGTHLGIKKKRLQVGLEYSYWRNKFAIRDSAALDTDQSVFSLLLQSHF